VALLSFTKVALLIYLSLKS